MSETVKLIIEIPKATYKDLKSGKIYSSLCEAPQGLVEGVRNGIPLDDVKAEIRELRDSWEKDCYHDEAEALNIALKIIDKHISEEGDKE